jgi:hypothetical protein
MRRNGLRRDPPLAMLRGPVSHDVPSSIRRGGHAQLIAQRGDMVRRLGASHCLTPLAAAWPRWTDRVGVPIWGMGPVMETDGIDPQVVLVGFSQTGP